MFLSVQQKEDKIWATCYQGNCSKPNRPSSQLLIAWTVSVSPTYWQQGPSLSSVPLLGLCLVILYHTHQRRGYQVVRLLVALRCLCLCVCACVSAHVMRVYDETCALETEWWVDEWGENNTRYKQTVKPEFCLLLKLWSKRKRVEDGGDTHTHTLVPLLVNLICLSVFTTLWLSREVTD